MFQDIYIFRLIFASDIELSIDTATFSRIMQHVPKYDNINFYIKNPKEEMTLGILTTNMRKGVYNNTTVIGNENGLLDDIKIPSQKFKGFLQMSAIDFQQNIHELFQTATVVTFATNYKDFRMITQNTSTGGIYAPRHLIFDPTKNGIRFLNDTGEALPMGVKVNTLALEDQDDCPLDPITLAEDDDSEKGE